MPARTLVTKGMIPFGTSGTGSGIAAGEPIASFIDEEQITAGIVNGDDALGGSMNGNGDLGGMIDDDNGLRGSKEDFEL